MLSSFKNLFSAPPAGNNGTIAIRPRKTGRESAVSLNRERMACVLKEIDAVFYGLLLGVQSSTDTDLNGFEKKVLLKLDQLLASDLSLCHQVPRLPAVIPQIMGTLRDRDSSTADLTAQLGRDAVLVSEVIRLANSPYYRIGKNITSLERAVRNLGRIGVRQLVANAAFKPLINLNSGHFSKLSGTVLWEQSEKTAVACDRMAKEKKTDRLNAYLAAIVQNVGFTIALKVLDRHFDGKHAPRSELFREQLIDRSKKLSAIIAREWGFPAPVLNALEAQTGSGYTADRPMLETILYVGDKLAKMHILAAQGRCKWDNEGIAARLQRRLMNSHTDYYTALSA